MVSVSSLHRSPHSLNTSQWVVGKVNETSLCLPYKLWMTVAKQIWLFYSLSLKQTSSSKQPPATNCQPVGEYILFPIVWLFPGSTRILSSLTTFKVHSKQTIKNLKHPENLTLWIKSSSCEQSFPNHSWQPFTYAIFAQDKYDSGTFIIC